MNHIWFFSLLALALVLATGAVHGDRLPNQTPENQVFTIDTIIDVTGTVDDTTTMNWLIASPGSIPEGILGESQTISAVSYVDSVLTNGGKVTENKNFDFDSQDKADGLFNVEAEKVLTYASTDGAHLTGEEYAILDVAGNFTETGEEIRCVFASAESEFIPAFCNIVRAKSSLVNVNSAQVSTKAQIRAVAESADTPAAMNYLIAVTPDANSDSGFAEATIATEFAGHVLEARNGGADAADWNLTAADNAWSDKTEVTGGIRNFQKTFAYQSGLML